MYDKKLIDFANAEMVFAGGGRSSLRRARAVYDNDQALFCEVLDALCLGKVGDFATFGALCDDADAVAVVAKTPAAWRLVLLIEGALASVLASGAALGAVLADDAALMALMECGPSLEAFLADDDAVASLLADGGAVAAAAETAGFSSALASDAGLRAAALASETALPAVAASPVSMAALAASEGAMAEFSADARLLNAIAKSPAAREAWMRSGLAHVHFDAIHDTLHAASDDLFGKFEDYWDTAPGKAYTSFRGPRYTLPTGYLSNDSTAPVAVNRMSHGPSVPHDAIVLLRRAMCDWSSVQKTGHYGSSQTKEDVMATSSSVLVDAGKVLVGGMSYYEDPMTSSGTYYGNDFKATYAVYIAK